MQVWTSRKRRVYRRATIWPCKEGYVSSDVHTEDNINRGSSLQHPFWHPCTNDLNFLVRLHHGSWKTFDIVALPRIHYYLTLRDY